jgi:hypothetical protein
MANLVKLTGSGGGGAYVSADIVDYVWANILRVDLTLLMLGIIGRNQYGGGDDNIGILASSVTDALNQGDGFEIDNTSNQLSGSTGVVIQVRVRVRVENAGISVTPRIYNVTDSSVPTQSGAAACTATATDFSGTNQQQTIALTPVSGKKKYKVQITPSAATYQAWASGILWDLYIA